MPEDTSWGVPSMGCQMWQFKSTRPGSDRYALNIGATIFRSDGSAVSVTLVDMSFEDCEISSDMAFCVGERCRLYRSGQGLIEAEVGWSNNGHVGLLFLSACRA